MKSPFGRRWLKSLIFIASFLTLAASVSATTVMIPYDDDLIVGARAIVTGKVVSVESAWDESHNRIYTYITLRVKQVLKGEITEKRIVLKELGGRVGDEGLTVWGSPEFTKGERVLVYLDTWPDGSLRTHQMLLGKFSIINDEATGHRFVVRDLNAENVTVLPRIAGHDATGGPSTDRMELSAYQDMVRTRLMANFDRSDAFQREHYSGAPMLMRPAEYVDSGGFQTQWSYISSAHPRWFEPDSGQPVVFNINPAGAPNAQIFDDINAAMGAWSNVPNCSMRVASGNTTSGCLPTTAENVILFNNCDGRWSPTSGCSSVLALGGLSWFPGSTRVVNGVTFVQATSGFVSFNPFASCSFGSHCNVQEIATHEIGHALGLGHSTDTSATMAAFAHFDGRCASIRPDDVTGITFIYPGTGGGGGSLSVVTSSLPGGTVGASYSQTLTASGGTPGYSWSLLSGSLPGGLSLSSGGTISGTPNAAGTFSFTVRVTDQVQATAQKALSIVVSSGSGQFASQFVSQTVPTSLSPGQTFTSTLTWQNTGTATWQGSAGLRLLSQNPPNNVTWGGNTVLLGSITTPPGQQMSISFQAVAPSTPGTYNFQWIVASGPSAPFGQPSTNVTIQVGGGGGGTDGATFTSQSVPTSLAAGQTISVSVTMTNSGSTTWGAGSYTLRSLNPAGNTTWGLSQVGLGSSVAPGGSATFSFLITAPPAAGTYNFQWGMANAAGASFGSPSTNVAITVTGGGLSAQFISQNMPTSLSAGQSVSVTVNMKNNGTIAWSPTTHKLGSQNPANNMTWGINRTATAKSVSVGVTAAFTFTVTAPSTAGTYNFQWQMVNQSTGAFFGQVTTNIAVQVGGGGGGSTDSAVFVSQSVPSSMTTGQVVPVSVTMKNNGTSTWQSGTYTLGSLNPSGNTTWGLNSVNLASSVAPGANATFNFNATAPGVAGSYNFQWGMKKSGVSFGSASTNVLVTVTSGGGGTDSAQFVSQSVPASLNTGQGAVVSVVMNNNGSTTWLPGTYSLGSRNPAGSTTWGMSSVALASSVAPGGNATFSFTITAPATAGTYNFQWQMQKGATSFGALSTNVAVTVSAAGGPPPTINTTSLPTGTKGVPYNAQISVSGGVAPYIFTVSTGALPAGVSLNRNTGVVSGVATVTGTFNFTVNVRDQAGATTSKAYKVAWR